MGIVSWGYYCHEAPHVQASVAYYLDWIYYSMRAYDDESMCGFKPAQRAWLGQPEMEEPEKNATDRANVNTLII